MKVLIAVLNRRGEPAAKTAEAMLKALAARGAETFGLASSTRLEIKASLEQLQLQEFKSPALVGHVFSKILAHDKPQPVMLENAALVFEGRAYKRSSLLSLDSIVGMLEGAEMLRAETFFGEVDGCFAFAIAKPEGLVVGRDPLGLHPLYYGENEHLCAVASERKALWKVGIREAQSFPPGHIALIRRKGFEIKPVKPLKRHRVRRVGMREAVEKLQGLLGQSALEKVSGLGEVAVAFSGGLDSSLTAWLAERAGVRVHLVHVSLENQRETKHAEEAAEMLNLPLHVYTYSERDVEETLPKVLWTVECADAVKASIGIPVYWAAEKTAELGFRVLLAGQGADELFGGYKRYVDTYLRLGGRSAHKAMQSDVLKLYETNFERDFKLCNFHNVELRLPFATYQLAEFALSLPLRLKICLKNDMLRKVVLRKTAQKFGLPPQITNRPKKAVQYATGVSKTLERLAKRESLPLNEYVQKIFSKVFPAG
ncbi:MAG: asparagine synthetase B [Nitrososphaerota archaeon]|nr:asparagine synthetase B [Nitrososphaerota archaeon]